MSHWMTPLRRRTALMLAGLFVAAWTAGWAVPADDLPAPVRDAEAKRVAAVEKVKPAVVSIFAAGGQGGGSGVVISEDGYALTNFHVVEGCGPVMQCGLPDGVLYDAVLVGLDKVGDVALIKLLPKKDGQKFPAAALGDSDKLKAGDWSLAMGNPFLLATDFTPTVTYGLISGLHRYQYPSGTLLEYTDCIQIDTSINPGNSGGPLFNVDGELVGINGRGSFEKRGRVNSGVGYAISINQIKNFLGHLRAGLDADHASLGAQVETPKDEGASVHLLVRGILDARDCDARRRGLDAGDELLAFAGRPMTTVNQFKNVLGLYPKGWRVPLTYRHEGERKEILVRLMGVQRHELDEGNQPKPDEPQPPGRPQPGRPAPGRPGAPAGPPAPPSPALKLYEAKAGYANFYFNRMERDRLLAAFARAGDFTPLTGEWTIEASGDVRDRAATLKAVIGEEKEKGGTTAHTMVRMVVGGVEFELEPLRLNQDNNALREPPGSGGLMEALYQYRQFLTTAMKGYAGEISHGGTEPFYAPAVPGKKPDYATGHVECEVINTRHGGIATKWYFNKTDGRLVGFEVTTDREEDPCEVFVSDYRPVQGRQLPHRLEIHSGDKRYASLTVTNYQLK